MNEAIALRSLPSSFKRTVWERGIWAKAITTIRRDLCVTPCNGRICNCYLRNVYWLSKKRIYHCSLLRGRERGIVRSKKNSIVFLEETDRVQISDWWNRINWELYPSNNRCKHGGSDFESTSMSHNESNQDVTISTPLNAFNNDAGTKKRRRKKEMKTHACVWRDVFFCCRVTTRLDAWFNNAQCLNVWFNSTFHSLDQAATIRIHA